MGRTFDEIDASLVEWVAAQPMFFVATAPNGGEGHVNVSPKGGRGSLHILGPRSVAYIDLMGSGIETVAHLRENGRITLMFCAFEGPPKVLRFYGQGRVVQQDDEEFMTLIAQFQPSAELLPIIRSVILVDVTRIADSCGFVVPRMDFVAERDQLMRWGERRSEREGPDWAHTYMLANNTASIDGLAALELGGDLAADDAARLSSVGRAL